VRCFPMRFAAGWSRITSLFEKLAAFEGDGQSGDHFLAVIQHQLESRGPDYIAVIKALSAEDAGAGSQWLDSIVQKIYAETLDCVAS